MAPTAIELLSLRRLVLAALAAKFPDAPGTAPPAFLPAGPEEFLNYLEHPVPEDEPLLTLANFHGLSLAEIAVLAVALQAETNPGVAQIIAQLQQPLGRARPLIGFLAVAFEAFVDDVPFAVHLATGAAVRTGILELTPAGASLTEQSVSAPLHIVAAIHGRDALPPQSAWLGPEIPLPPSIETQARKYAQSLRRGHLDTLAIR